MSENYNTNKTNCIRCGTVMAWGWVLTCPACTTVQKLEEQNQILSQSELIRNRTTSYSQSESSPAGIGSTIFGLVLIFLVIGFLFFPDWGILTFVRFLWTVFLLLLSGVLAIPIFIWEVLF